MLWLANNYGNIIVILLVAGLIYLCARSVFGSKQKGCVSCDCDSCSGCSACTHANEIKEQLISLRKG